MIRLRQPFAVALVFVVVIIIFSLFQSTVVAPDPTIAYYVPDNYSTLQGAITAASPGSIIIVRDGVYNGSISIDKALTVISENGPANCILVSDEPSYNVGIYSDNVEFSGFTIGSGVDPYGDGIGVVYSQHCNITNNVIEGKFYGILVRSNYTSVSNNTISNNRDGIMLESSGQWEPVIGNTFSNNLIINNSNVGIYFAYAHNNNITGNFIGYNANHNIRLGYFSSNNLIYNNTIYNGNEGICIGAGYFTAPHNIVMNCTIFYNDLWGIRVNESEGTVIQYCNIYGNGMSGASQEMPDPTYAVNATNNWWGAPDGPGGAGQGSGDAVSANVLFDPWLADWAFQPSMPPSTPPYSPILPPFTDYVPDNYTTLQAAIAGASSGSTIIVRDGVYQGSIEINKPLIVRSENGFENCTIIGDTHSSVIGIFSDHVEVSGFTVDSIYSDTYGISAANASHCNISNNNIFGVGYGIGLWASNYTIVSDNYIHDNFGGIMAESWGIWEPLVANTFANNSITNNSNIGLYLAYCKDSFVYNNSFISNVNDGVRVAYSSSGNLISNNNVSGSRYGMSVGLWFSAPNNIIEHCTIHGNEIGIGAVATEGTVIRYCYFYNNSAANFVNFTTSASSYGGTLLFNESQVAIDVVGSAKIYVANYESAPTGNTNGSLLSANIGKYVDVFVPDSSNLNAMVIRMNYTLPLPDGAIESALKMYWYNGSVWAQCSDTGVNTNEKYIWARINESTTPSTSDFGGTIISGSSYQPIQPATPTLTWYIIGGAITVVVIILAAYYMIAMRPKNKLAK